MKIQYMSDLHFEFRENSRYIKHNEFPVTGDILVGSYCSREPRVLQLL